MILSVAAMRPACCKPNWPNGRNSAATRGRTSHTYDAAKAQAIFDTIPGFWVEARFLLARIAERQEIAP